MGCTEDKLVLFFSPESWDNGQTRNENLSKIRGLLTVWHALKLYLKNSKKVSKNRPAVTKGHFSNKKTKVGKYFTVSRKKKYISKKEPLCMLLTM